MELISPEKVRPPTDVLIAVRRSTSRSNWRNAIYLAIDWLLIGAVIAAHLIWGGIALYLIALLVIGVRMRALGNLLHEAAHAKLFANRTLNDLAGRVACGWPILVDFPRYAARHRLHHRNLWRDDNDPDVALYRLTGTEDASVDRLSFVAFVLRHVVLVVVPVMPWRRLLAGRRTVRPTVWIGAVAVLAATAVIMPPVAIGIAEYWLMPWLTIYQSCSYWAELGEHGGLRAAGHDWGSRNWRGNLVTRWAIGSHSDDLYHLLHHWFPAVPHHRLRAVDKVCTASWPAYAAQARCGGFFRGGRIGVSVLRDVWTGGGTARR